VEDGNVVATGSNDADSKVVFSSITYTQPGSHVYTVREVKGSETGVTYDDHNYLVYTLITDKGDGTLEVTHQAVSSEENDELVPAEGNAVTFNNIYKRNRQQ
jgi:pilin isopeptide linkage protein